ncbi:hypothetical protein XENTR_v10011876 [Xenopus tropicalis]|nr:hypothetical protein XENTR_v10011876 [Xenopus tropicalis]
MNFSLRSKCPSFKETMTRTLLLLFFVYLSCIFFLKKCSPESVIVLVVTKENLALKTDTGVNLSRCPYVSLNRLNILLIMVLIRAAKV